jgi:hypothetical protein
MVFFPFPKKFLNFYNATMRKKISTRQGKPQNVNIGGSDVTLLDLIVNVCVEVDARHCAPNLCGANRMSTGREIPDAGAKYR